MTAQKNIHFLKESIFKKLHDDATLITLLAGADRIFNRDIPKEVVYPCIVYNILSDTQFTYNEAQCGSRVSQTYFTITIFSNNPETESIDNIEARVFEILNGQRTLDNTKIICYGCYKDNILEPMKDPDLQVWVMPIRYRVTWSTK